MTHFKCVTKIAILSKLMVFRKWKRSKLTVTSILETAVCPYLKKSLHKASHGGQFGPRRNWRMIRTGRTKDQQTETKKIFANDIFIEKPGLTKIRYDVGSLFLS